MQRVNSIFNVDNIGDVGLFNCSVYNIDSNGV